MTNPYFTAIMDIVTWVFDNGAKIIALGGIMYWLYKTLVIPVAGVGKKVTQLVIDTDHLKTDFKKVRSDADDIKKELQSNGGGSLKDAVKRVEEKTDAQTIKLELLEKGHMEIQATQKAQAQFLTPRFNTPSIRVKKK